MFDMTVVLNWFGHGPTFSEIWKWGFVGPLTEIEPSNAEKSLSAINYKVLCSEHSL